MQFHQNKIIEDFLIYPIEKHNKPYFLYCEFVPFGFAGHWFYIYVWKGSFYNIVQCKHNRIRITECT